MGLHGKSFIPLIMGFGWNVPASDGNENHRESPFASGYDADSAIDELFCSSANLHHGHRNVLCHPIPFAHQELLYLIGIFLAVIFQPHLCQFRGEGRRYPIRYGAASLPLPYLEGDRPTYLGEG